MIQCNSPLWLLAAIFIPLFFIVSKTFGIRRPAFVAPLLNWGEKRFFVPKYFSRLFLSAQFLLVIALLCLVFSLARPMLLQTKKMFYGTGHTVMFVLDISPSMATKDMGEKRRIDVAKSIITEFVHYNEGCSFGITAIGSSAALVLPPTIDTEAFLRRLDELQIGELGSGTALGMGIMLASAQMLQNDMYESYIIVLTDGENNAGEIHPNLAAQMVAKRQLSFCMVGIGSSGQAPFEYVDPITKKTYSGVMQSLYNSHELQEIARHAGGQCFFAQSTDKLKTIFDSVSGQLVKKNIAFVKTIEKPLDTYFITAACVLFGFAGFILAVILQVPI